MGKIAEALRRFARGGNPKAFERPSSIIAEEVELRSYQEEDRRDRIRAAVLKKRSERIRNLFGTENYDLTRAKQQRFKNLKKAKPQGLLDPVRL
jgi:hypothetical protein